MNLIVDLFILLNSVLQDSLWCQRRIRHILSFYVDIPNNRHIYIHFFLVHYSSHLMYLSQKKSNIHNLSKYIFRIDQGISISLESDEGSRKSKETNRRKRCVALIICWEGEGIGKKGAGIDTIPCTVH